MSDGAAKLLFAVALGGAAAAAFVALRRRAAAPPVPTEPNDPCAPAKVLGQEAYLACKAAQIVGVLTQGESAQEADAANIPLNGAVVGQVPIDPRYHSTGQGYVLHGAHGASGIDYGAMMPGQNPSAALANAVGTLGPAFKGRYVSIYANGCVPLSGDPRFAKCAPNTHRFNHLGAAGNGRPWDASQGPSQPNDPLTHEHLASNKAGAFPLNCPPGYKRWWLSGTPTCCPPNAVMGVRHNADGSLTATCQAPASAPTGTGQVVPANYVNPVKLAAAKADCQRRYGAMGSTAVQTCNRLSEESLRGKP